MSRVENPEPRRLSLPAYAQRMKERPIMCRFILVFFATTLLLVVATGAAPVLSQIVYVDPGNSYPEDEQFTIAIVLDTNGQDVMGIEISISFDEYILHLDGIEPGPWFTDLDHDYFFWDFTHPETELIRFAASSLGSGVVESGVVAICHFTALAGGLSPLVFLGVDVRDSQNNILDYGHSTGDSILIDGAIGTAGSSLDRIKALFR